VKSYRLMPVASLAQFRKLHLDNRRSDNTEAALRRKRSEWQLFALWLKNRKIESCVFSSKLRWVRQPGVFANAEMMKLSNLQRGT
jgi:hypothetical protein